MEDITKTIMFTTNSLQGTPTIQYQTVQASDITLKQPKLDGQKQEFPTFCYVNSNMIQKITPASQVGNVSTVNLAQLTTEDNKTHTVQYIAQPLGYNYALVNPMQIQNGVNTITVDGRQLIVNKPLTTNTISNISFKCDVCGLMFAHLTLLNQHKRSHQEHDGTHDGTPTAITLVTGQPNIVQTQNLISETGQSLGQIQIVATETLEPAQLQHAEVTVAAQQTQTTQKVQVIPAEKVQRCITCGGHIQTNPKRKGPKLIRCENCIANDANSSRPTQIFVAPDGDIKFEIGDINDNEPHQNVQQVQSQQQKLPPGAHPVKKRNTGTVTKCNKCNGSGVIYIGGAKKNSQQQQNEKPFTCNICGGRFSRYSSLWSHKKLHSGEKNYKCGVCQIAFAKAVYLKNHTRIHTGEKPYKCGTCGMQFSQSPHLKNHERTHSGEKPYVCEVCDKGFARHATLWNHRRIHTGEKPYKCDRCQSAFSQAAHLKNHEKVHSGIKPFKCDICSAAFADRFALKRHRNIHEKYGQIPPGSSNNATIVTKQEKMDDETIQEIVISGM